MPSASIPTSKSHLDSVPVELLQQVHRVLVLRYERPAFEPGTLSTEQGRLEAAVKQGRYSVVEEIAENIKRRTA